MAEATLVGVLTTLLGLAFALVALRTRLPMKPLLRALSILPIITPPFVIGLALILLFGRAGMLTVWLGDVFGIPRSRWIYGMPGITIAQVLAFTPIAMHGAVGRVARRGTESRGGIADPACQHMAYLPHRHLAADPAGPRQRLPDRLYREHGGLRQSADDRRQFHVLSTDIFFAVVGASHDQGRAAVLAIVLLAFTLTAFLAQRLWLGRPQLRDDVAGKGDAGIPATLPVGVRAACYVRHPDRGCFSPSRSTA